MIKNPQDKQEIFDFVLESMIKQGQKSITRQQCRYRDNSDNKCAAGFLIPDEEYTEEFEGSSIQTIYMPIQALCLEGSKITKYFLDRGYDTEFLKDLQHCHDEASEDNFIINFKTLMKLVADKYNLTYKEPRIE